MSVLAQYWLQAKLRLVEQRTAAVLKIKIKCARLFIQIWRLTDRFKCATHELDGYMIYTLPF